MVLNNKLPKTQKGKGKENEAEISIKKRRLKFAKLTPRQQELAKPKIDYKEYNSQNRPFPRVNANNQETIYPISLSTLTYIATDRINFLAKPRMPDFTPHSLLDKYGKPADYREVPRSALFHVASRRLNELALPAERYRAAPDTKWRYEMVGHVQSGALLYRISDRIKELAKHRQEPEEHMWYSCGPYPYLCRSNPYDPAHDALLARPKCYYQPPFDYDEWALERRRRASRHETTDREHDLAVPVDHSTRRNIRLPHEVYAIPRRALKHRPTPGDIKRSAPKVPIPTMWERDFNPDAFVITPIMLRALCTKRTGQLSEPKTATADIC